jgi:hypothetical protein
VAKNKLNEAKAIASSANLRTMCDPLILPLLNERGT